MTKSNTSTVSRSSAAANPSSAFVCGPLSQISDGGTFIINQTGELLRVDPQAVKQGHSPLFSIVTNTGEVTVTRLANDPYIPISKARQLAADADFQPNF